MSWSQVAAIGLANQRETTVVWERATGRPVGPAIVWQSRQTADACLALRQAGWSETVQRKTGLPIDPYFSATKLRWLLDRVPEGHRRAEAGDLLGGTVDSWLLWILAGVHRTDPTNASRTLLYDIHQRAWDPELLAIFGIPLAMLPEVRPSVGVFGETAEGTPIVAVAGDQQAALFGQVCFASGESKTTFGTGAFLLMNTGEQAISSEQGLLTTLALDAVGETCYALEGAVFTAGAAVDWLRDGLKIVDDVAETAALARSVPDSADVVFVPAFSGLGSPHWDPTARGTILGLTAGAGRAHLVRATLEAIALQTVELFEAMRREFPAPVERVRVDGGGSANDFTMQRLADLLGLAVERPKIRETTALGAAFLGGLAAGFWPGGGALADRWELEHRFEPSISTHERRETIERWRSAVDRAKGWAT